MQRKYLVLLVALGAMAAPFASAQTCAPPPGFVDTPHPEIAPVAELLSHTEEITIERPLAFLRDLSSRTPLEKSIDRTSGFPAVTGTHRLTQGPWQPGTRRLVCHADGSIVVEQVLIFDQQPDREHFRYVVWNYTSRKYPPIKYAVAEFVKTEIAGTRTHVRWTYSFQPDGVSDASFREPFLEGQFAQWMRNNLAGGKQRAEALAQTCAPPPGFVDTPHPELAPVEQLLSRVEETTIERPLAVVRESNSKLTLEQGIDRTSGLPGVTGTHRLTQGPFQAGTRRLVCLTDGSTVVEQVLVMEQHPRRSRFRYVVWNYTSSKFPPIRYAIGEFVHTAIGDTRTHVRWTYSFGPNGLSDASFREQFLDGQFSQWMRNTLAIGKKHAEGS